MSLMIFSSLISAIISLECSSLPSQNITIDIMSDLDDWVVGNLHPEGSYAVATQNIYTRNTRPYGLKIWESSMPYDPRQNTTCFIGKNFYVPGTPLSATLDIVADDKCTVMINNKATGCFTASFEEYKLCNVDSYIISGLNNLNITVTNVATSYDYNPASINYWLHIVSSVKMIDKVN